MIKTLLTKEKGFLLEDLGSGEMGQSEYDDKLTIVCRIESELNEKKDIIRNLSNLSDMQLAWLIEWHSTGCEDGDYIDTEFDDLINELDDIFEAEVKLRGYDYQDFIKKWSEKLFDENKWKWH